MQAYSLNRDEETIAREQRVQLMLKEKFSFEISIKKMYVQALAEFEKKLREEGYGDN